MKVRCKDLGPNLSGWILMLIGVINNLRQLKHDRRHPKKNSGSFWFACDFTFSSQSRCHAGLIMQIILCSGTVKGVSLQYDL